MYKQTIQFSLRSKLILACIAFSYLSSCQQAEEFASSISTDTGSTLYVATGACNSGHGITTYTSSTATRTIERFNASTGSSLGMFFDYSSVQSGMPGLTYPAGIYNSGSNLYLLNEGGASVRSIINVPKSSAYDYSTYVANNPTAFTGVLNSFTFDDEGSVLIAKTTGVEKFNSTPVRLSASGAAWVNGPGGACFGGSSNTTTVLTMPSSAGVKGHVIVASQGATSGTNKLSIIYGSTGYINTSNCLSGVIVGGVTHRKAANLVSGTIAFVSTGTSPTSMLFIPRVSGTVVGKLIVSYSNSQTANSVSGSATTLNHGIVSWDVSQTTAVTATLSNPVVLFEDHNVVFATSAMAYDSATSSLYLAVGGVLGSTNQASIGIGYNIEKFNLSMANANTTGPELTRVSPTFILGGSNTKCISGMAIGE